MQIKRSVKDLLSGIPTNTVDPYMMMMMPHIMMMMTHMKMMTTKTATTVMRMTLTKTMIGDLYYLDVHVRLVS